MVGHQTILPSSAAAPYYHGAPFGLQLTWVQLVSVFIGGWREKMLTQWSSMNRYVASPIQIFSNARILLVFRAAPLWFVFRPSRYVSPGAPNVCQRKAFLFISGLGDFQKTNCKEDPSEKRK